MSNTIMMKANNGRTSEYEQGTVLRRSINAVPKGQEGISLFFIVTCPVTAKRLLKSQAIYLQSIGFRVSIVAAPDKAIQQDLAAAGITFFGIPMSREISIFQDLRTLVTLIRLLAKCRPQIVNASTPKAGLLGMIAAWLVRIPHRIYLVRGLRLETTSGKLRSILASTEKIASYCATSVLAVSASLRDQYIREGFLAARKIRVLGHGTSNGVELSRFEQAKMVTRSEFGIYEEAKVMGFVGRMTRDKGIADLLEVYKQLRSEFDSVRLLIVGDFEDGDHPDKQTVKEILSSDGIICTGFVDDAAPYYQVMDVLVFPSAREGFPNVPIEASAAGLPVVAYKATGTSDAVEHEKTGKLVPYGNPLGLVKAIRCYFENQKLRQSHGENGKRMVKEKFSHQAVREYYAREYMSLVHQNE